MNSDSESRMRSESHPEAVLKQKIKFNALESMLESSGSVSKAGGRVIYCIFGKFCCLYKENIRHDYEEGSYLRCQKFYIQKLQLLIDDLD